MNDLYTSSSLHNSWDDNSASEFVLSVDFKKEAQKARKIWLVLARKNLHMYFLALTDLKKRSQYRVGGSKPVASGSAQPLHSAA